MTKINKAQVKEDVVNILNHVTETLFFFFEQYEEDLDTDDKSLNEFAESMWSMANIVMAATGMSVVGRNDDGSINVIFNPVKSVKKFLQEEYTGDDSDRYFEEMITVNDKPEDIDLGDFEELFTNNIKND